MAAWVTLDAAKAHLYIPAAETRHDAGVTAAAAEATDILSQYLKRPAEAPVWDETTAPPRIQASVKLLLGWLWTSRDDQAKFAAIWKTIVDLTAGDRDPAVV